LGKRFLTKTGLGRVSFLSFFLLILSVLPSICQATLLENIPLDSWVYSTVDELYSQGLFPELHRNVKPYTRGEIASYILEINQKQKKQELELTSSQLWLLEKLNQEFRFEIEELYQERYPLEIPPLDRLRVVTVRLRSLSLSKVEGSEVEPPKAGKDENRHVLKYGTYPVFYSDITGNDSSYCRLQAKFDAALQFDKRLVLKDRVIIDTKAEKERRYWGRKWKRDLTGVFDEAYAQVDLKYFYLLLGRDHLRWGPGKKDVLLLSDQISPFDMLKLEGRLGSFKFIYFTTILDQLWVPLYSDSGNLVGVFFAKRYFSGHRLNLKLKFGLEMGISEVVVYGGQNRNPEPYYLNPLLPYYGEQFNQDLDDNPLWAFDLALTWFKNKEFYAEILVDDFQYDFKSEPQQTGFQIGFDCAQIFGLQKSFTNFEYTKINNWVYGQNKPWNIYTYHGFGMGSILGPDADRLFLKFAYHLRKDIEFSFSEYYKRKGEGRIETPQTSAVSYPKKFPSGVVEYTNQIRFETSYQPSSNFKLDWDWTYTRIRNFQNVGGKKTDDFGLEMRLNLNLCKERRF